MYINFDKNFDTLCFSGGGTKGLVFIGAVKALIDKNIINLENINKFIGTSAGAILAFFLAIGYTPDELEEFVLNFDFKKLEPNVDCDNLFSSYGIDDGKKLEYLLVKLLNHKLGKNNITFLELFELTNNELIVSTTCINNSKAKYFNYKFTPDDDVVLAIRMSIAVPFYFHPVIFEGNHYVDGGILDNYPIQFGNRDSSIGFTVVSDKYSQIEDFGNYMIKVIKLFLNASLLNKVRLFKDCTINIVCGEKNFIDFKMDYQAKKIMIDKGYDRVRKYYQEFLKNLTDNVINDIINKVEFIHNNPISDQSNSESEISSQYLDSYSNSKKNINFQDSNPSLSDSDLLDNDKSLSDSQNNDISPELISNGDTSEVFSQSSLSDNPNNEEKSHFNLS